MTWVDIKDKLPIENNFVQVKCKTNKLIIYGTSAYLNEYGVWIGSNLFPLNFEVTHYKESSNKNN